MKTQFSKLFLASVSTLAIIIVFAFSVPQQKAAAPWTIPAKYKSMKNPIPGKNVDTGKSLYSKYCKTCHGALGKGDSPRSKTLKTNCGDFSSAKFQGQSDGEIYYEAIVGRTEMPNFEKKILSENDRWALINYMRTLKK